MHRLLKRCRRSVQSSELFETSELFVGVWLGGIPQQARALPVKQGGMNLIQLLTGIVLHLDKVLSAVIAQYGAWTYAIMFLVLFV